MITLDKLRDFYDDNFYSSMNPADEINEDEFKEALDMFYDIDIKKSYILGMISTYFLTSKMGQEEFDKEMTKMAERKLYNSKGPVGFVNYEKDA